MSAYLLDTNALSEFVKLRGNPGFAAWFSSARSQQLFVSCITIGEIQKGAHLVREPARQKHFLDYAAGIVADYADRLVIVDTDACLLWGKLVADAQLRGKTPQMVDSLLAAQAMQHNLTLVTRNVKDFEQFAGLRLLCPWS